MLTLLSPTTILSIWLLTGMFLGLTASVYGAAIRVYRLGFVIHLLDALWFAMAACLTVLMLVATNWGVLRAWTIAALVLGYLLWAISAGRLVYRLSHWIFLTEARLAKRVLRFGRLVVNHAQGTVPTVAGHVRRHVPKTPRLPRIRRPRKPPQK
jgi:hypothetical protein